MKRILQDKRSTQNKVHLRKFISHNRVNFFHTTGVVLGIFPKFAIPEFFQKNLTPFVRSILVPQPYFKNYKKLVCPYKVKLSTDGQTNILTDGRGPWFHGNHRLGMSPIQTKKIKSWNWTSLATEYEQLQIVWPYKQYGAKYFHPETLPVLCEFMSI